MNVAVQARRYLTAIMLLHLIAGCAKAPTDVTRVRLNCDTVASSESVATSSAPETFWLSFDLGSKQVFLQGTDTSVEMLQVPSSGEIRLKTVSDLKYTTEITVARNGAATYKRSQPRSVDATQTFAAHCERE